jgi:hypothetical protein
MKDLADAEIVVDTVFSMESGAGNGNRFYMAEYDSMCEFETDCASWFSDEEAPEYLYTDWNGIPDYLISRTWLCPNIFEIRDALRMLDGQSIDGFPEWCRNNGHDITTDDAMMLVTRYQDYISPSYESDTETAEPDDGICAVIPHTLAELGSIIGTLFGRVEIFDDDYG